MGAYSITGLVLTLPTTPNQVADVISLHLPLTPQTAGLINKETIAKMKPKVCGRAPRRQYEMILPHTHT